MSKKMHPLIRSYLKSLASELRGSRERDLIVEEITSHLLDTVERFRDAGIEEHEAVLQALKRMGDARMLGGGLRTAHRPLYLRWFFVIPTYLMVACGLAIVALSVLTDMRLHEAEDSIRQEDRALALFFKDQDALKKYPFLGPAGRTHDAGAFLNTRVAWEGSKIPERYKHPSIFLNDEQRNLLKGQEWINRPLPKELKKVDLSWMEKLHEYDHWDLWATEGLGRDDVMKGMHYGGLHGISYAPLVSFARLRYLKGLKRGQALKALKDVRHLIVLINSNEVLVGPLIAASLLRDEAKFYQEAIRRKFIKPQEWSVVPEEDRLAFRRAAYSAPEWLDILTPADMFRRMAERSTSMVGFCGALAESEDMRYITKKYFEPRIWPEADLKPNLDRVRNLEKMNASRCRLTYSKLSSPNSSWAPYGRARSIYSFYHRVAVRVPFLRRFEGATFHAEFSAHWTGQYDKLIAEQDKDTANRMPAQFRPSPVSPASPSGRGRNGRRELR